MKKISAPVSCITKYSRLGIMCTSLMLALSPCLNGQVTITADADAYLRAGNNSDDNYGNTDDLEIKGSDTLIYTRKSIVRFDLGTVTDSVTATELSFTLLDGSFASPPDKEWTFEVYGLNASASDQDWVEGTGETNVTGATPPNAIVWDNAPGNNTSSSTGVDSATTTLVGSFTITGAGTAGTVKSISGSALDDFLNTRTGGSATFLIVRTTTDNNNDPSMIVIHQIASITNATYDGPQLTYTAIPESATSALVLALGVLALSIIRRQRKR